MNILRQVARQKSISIGNKMLTTRFYSIYEPEYLESLKSPIPLYPTMCVKISGYTYPTLESFQGFIHKIARQMDIDIEEGYAYPLKKLQIKRYKPASSVVAMEYTLNIYKRHILLSDVTATQMPIFIRLLEAALPEGVSLEIEPYDPEKAEKRYIPDTKLLDLQEELSSLKKK